MGSFGSLVWSRRIVDLSAFAGKRVRIGFFHVAEDDGSPGSDAGSGWYVDDAEIRVVTPTFTGDFESGWADWSVSNGIWEVGPPAAGPGICIGGAQCAGTVLGGNYEPNTNSRLESPPLVLPVIAPGEELQLRFWQWFSYSSSDSGTVQVAVFDPVTQVFGNWQPAASAVGGVSGAWTQRLVDMSSFAGRRVRIGFFHSAVDDGSPGPDVSTGWYVDDLCLVLPDASLTCFTSTPEPTTTTSSSTTTTTSTSTSVTATRSTSTSTSTSVSTPTTVATTTSSSTSVSTTSTSRTTTSTGVPTTLVTTTSTSTSSSLPPPTTSTTLPSPCGNGTVDAGEQCDPSAPTNICPGTDACRADCTCADVCVTLTEGGSCSDDDECTDGDTCRGGMCTGEVKCRVILSDVTPVTARKPVVPVRVQGEPGARCRATLLPLGAPLTVVAQAVSVGQNYGTASGRIKRSGEVTLKVRLNRYGRELLRQADGSASVLADIVIKEKGARRQRRLRRVLLLRST